MAALLQRQFLLLSIGTALLFLLTSFFALHDKREIPTSSSLQLAASNVSSLVLIRIMSTEIPLLAQTVQAAEGPEPTSATRLLFELATGISPSDMRTLLGRELPGLLTYTDAKLREEQWAKSAPPAIESPPPEAVAAAANPDAPTDGAASDKPADQSSGGNGQQAPPADPDKKTVFIYHTHNRESWVNVAEPIGQSVDHPTKNITLVGKYLGEKLTDRGIGTIVNTDDIAQRLLDQKKSYALSYAESLKVISAAKNSNRELRYFFDLHRDSSGRKETTVDINGKSYARIYFIIGTNNKNYKKNQELANQLHQLLEKRYPGLSRGVDDKNKNEGNNGEYNQHVSPGSLLIEIGGKENTLQECYNTAEAFAEVFADFYWQAERVTAEQTDKR